MRHKVFSLINISGLALGMTCSILILLWVQDELSFDRFHEKSENLYLVIGDQHYPGADNMVIPAGPGLLAPALEEELPEVVRAIRVSWGERQLMNHGEKSLKVFGHYADPGFFQSFTFPLLHGDASQVLQQPRTVVLSDSVALRLFGTIHAVGRLLKLNNNESYTVTGIMRKVPLNSTLQFDFVMPYSDYEANNTWLKTWTNYGIQTFLELQPGTDIPAFNDKIRNFLRQEGRDMRETYLFVHALRDLHLYSDFRQGKSDSGLIVYVRIFFVVAVFILVIACINFINLATARASKRAREVGVRKAIGASRPKLFWQFMIESVLVAFLALFVALNLTGMFLPAFNNLTGKSVELNLSDPSVLLLLLGVALFTGLISGSYPALFLSSFDPATVLKGTVRLNNRVSFFRKALVVFQFALSALLIVCTLVVYLQLHYIRTKDIGLQRDNVVYVQLEGNLINRYETVRQELLRQSGIRAVSAANQVPLMISSNTGGVDWPGKEKGNEALFDMMSVDYEMLETMGIELKSGRMFSRDIRTDTLNYIVNEEAVRLMQLQNPLGQKIKLSGREGRIIGVVKDFQGRPMHMEIMPLIIRLDPAEANLLFVRLEKGKTTEALAAVETVVQKHNSAFPFNYRFLDSDFENLYRSEQIIGELTNYFAGIAIFISCLGLFGLALFTAEHRRKEIGIRKVLGASVASIVFMLSKDFLKLVLIANLIALPLGWYLMNSWLSEYAYRTELSWWIFAVAFLSTLLIAMLTLSYHALKTALNNPVDAIRSQ
ncbi:MAG: ABC transporter permease [Hymenobacteraceae bacterium]|nr:ABC transporter permease [Hymenobacteraceae bacterium]